MFSIRDLVLGVFGMGPLKGRLGRTLQGSGVDNSGLVGVGAPATGTVVAVRDLRMTIHHDPLVELRFAIVPDDGSPPFEGTTSAVVSRVHVPRPGDRFRIWYDRADPSRFAFGPAA